MEVGAKTAQRDVTQARKQQSLGVAEGVREGCVDRLLEEASRPIAPVPHREHLRRAKRDVDIVQGSGRRSAEAVRTSDLVLAVASVATLGGFCLLLAADILGNLAGI
ncbi:hypothetical protein GU700_00975 [Methylobacterium sp. NI91]|nr:hypothetical protein CLZ_00975 [Methylobacterium sp. CLZ]QIJ78206.1 hypothetical protein GU700_00975 [Methylobacterium sp. NI91]